MKAALFIGTSGWHYDDWIGRFYPPDVTGYKELTYHAQHFNSVENNSSFYRIAGEQTYRTWDKMTPEKYVFSLKLNRLVTHFHRLEIGDEVKTAVTHILDSTQVLGQKLGAILIQLPSSFRYDLPKLKTFLSYFCDEVRKREYAFDVAIEFRNRYWFNDDVYRLLGRHNVALVVGHSSRYPHVRQLTADIAYIRMHGPRELFASSYSESELEELADYIRRISDKVKKVYVYFNNDFYGFAIDNARQLMNILKA